MAEKKHRYVAHVVIETDRKVPKKAIKKWLEEGLHDDLMRTWETVSDVVYNSARVRTVDID